jgi:hypothetical protein
MLQLFNVLLLAVFGLSAPFRYLFQLLSAFADLFKGR